LWKNPKKYYCATREYKMAKELIEREGFADLLTTREHLNVNRLHLDLFAAVAVQKNTRDVKFIDHVLAKKETR